MLNKDFFRMGKLISVYGKMLSKKQLIYLQYYYEENYSIDEIGEMGNITRQAVYDVLKRSILKLEKYEEEFALIEIRELLEDLKKDKKYKERVGRILKDA
ncbi:hypothetical protein J7L48_02290 [bacterium]|nr:hypothetical protein [bacterium]